jgi:hypothetical protein
VVRPELCEPNVVPYRSGSVGDSYHDARWAARPDKRDHGMLLNQQQVLYLTSLLVAQPGPEDNEKKYEEKGARIEMVA